MTTTTSSTSMLRSMTILTAFACALAIASLLAAQSTAASDSDFGGSAQVQSNSTQSSTADGYHWLGRVLPGPFGVIPVGHDYRGHDNRGRSGHDDHRYSHRDDHHDYGHGYGGYERHGYRDYDRDSDSHHSVRHDYRHQGYYCSRCHYHTPSRHIFFEHLHHHHHIPWYEAVSYLVWSPIHLVFVFD